MTSPSTRGADAHTIKRADRFTELRAEARNEGKSFSFEGTITMLLTDVGEGGPERDARAKLVAELSRRSAVARAKHKLRREGRQTVEVIVPAKPKPAKPMSTARKPVNEELLFPTAPTRVGLVDVDD